MNRSDVDGVAALHAQLDAVRTARTTAGIPADVADRAELALLRDLDVATRDSTDYLTSEIISFAGRYHQWASTVERTDDGEPVNVVRYDEDRTTWGLEALDIITDAVEEPLSVDRVLLCGCIMWTDGRRCTAACTSEPHSMSSATQFYPRP